MRRGLALVLVVGVLAVLAVLGSAFAMLSRLERRAAQQRVHGTKAALLARSGLDDAQARMDAGQDPQYAGEDYNDDAVLNAGPETDAQVYQPARLNRDDCPAGAALRPSFARLMGGNPRLVRVDGRVRGFSGAPSGERETWSLKAVGAQGGFDVNGPDGPNLRRMLGILAEALDREDGADDGLPVDQADGERLIDLRPASGWGELGQVRDLALGGNAAKADLLGAYLAFQPWRDRKVLKPNPPSPYPNPVNGIPSWRSVKLNHPENVPGSRAPLLEARSPVDLSWARTRRPALIALMAGLKGNYLDECSGNWSSMGKILSQTLTLDWTQPTDDCRTASDWLLTSTSPIATWEQWNAFCDTVPFTGTSDIPEVKRSILKANFNPNSDLNKFNPDASMWRKADKSDLSVHSTEWILAPLWGGGKVTSVGRVLDSHGRLLASRTLSVSIAPDRVLRLTTQGELVAENLGDPDAAGDESAFRAYGDAVYISTSQGAGGKTFGHRLLGGSGVSLQAGPEPHVVPVPAVYDGQLRLATVETADGEHAPTGTSMMFLARWDDALDADFSGEGGSLAVRYEGNPSPPLPTEPLWDAVDPSTLRPDGVYSERPGTLVPGYEALGSSSAYHGTISFWMKPDYDHAKRVNGMVRGHMYFENCRTNEDLSLTAMFCLLHLGSDFANLRSWSQFWENAPVLTLDDTGHEQYRYTPAGTPCTPHRWYLLSFLRDMEPGGYDLSGRVLVDRGLVANASDRSTSNSYGTADNLPALTDFRYEFGVPGNPAVFYLGMARIQPTPFDLSMTIGAWKPAQATLDEFAIYDYGRHTGSGTDGIYWSEKMAQDRFSAGRFYKESDYFGLGNPGNKAGEWFSAPLDLGRVRLRSLAWSQIVPRGLRAPAPAGWPSPPDPAKPEDGDPGPDGRILLELTQASGTAYLVDRRFTAGAGEPVGRPADRPFRLHAVFQPNLEDPGNTAILDPLVLDDVTLTYRDLIRPAFGSWREGE